MTYSNLTNKRKKFLLISSKEVFFTIPSLKSDRRNCIFKFSGNGFSEMRTLQKFFNHPLDSSEFTFESLEGQMNVTKIGDNVIDCYTFDFLVRKQTVRIKLADIQIVKVVDSYLPNSDS